MQRDAALALLQLTRKINATDGTTDCMPEQPPKTVYLGSQVGGGGEKGWGEVTGGGLSGEGCGPPTWAHRWGGGGNVGG